MVSEYYFCFCILFFEFNIMLVFKYLLLFVFGENLSLFCCSESSRIDFFCVENVIIVLFLIIWGFIFNMMVKDFIFSFLLLFVIWIVFIFFGLNVICFLFLLDILFFDLLSIFVFWLLYMFVFFVMIVFLSGYIVIGLFVVKIFFKIKYKV